MLPISLSAGGGGPSGASGSSSMTTPFAFAFNFDNSGWVTNNKSSGTTSANGNKDANAQSQVPSSLAGEVLGHGNMPLLLLGGLAAWYFLR
ncbi:MAG: hypothetical protein ABI351_12085 [Herbaspirillum sp.]